jgi:hypothetical protein
VTSSRTGALLSDRDLRSPTMAFEALGPWEPLDLKTTVTIFRGFPGRLWISSGYALELHLSRSWRSHDDIDVGVLRNDAYPANGGDPIHHYLASWLDSKMVLRRARSLRLARLIAWPSTGAIAREKPEGSPRFRKYILVPPDGNDSHR